MKIIGKGFTAPQNKAEAAELATKLSPLLEFTENAVNLCQQTLESIDVGDQHSNTGKQKTIASILLARMLETAEAIICLSRCGFGNDVNPMFRVFIEAYFIFGNVCKDAKFIPEYFATDLANRQRVINAAIKHKDSIFQSLKEYATEEMRETLKKEIEDAKASILDTFKNANAIGCAHIYDSIYRITSAETHTTPRSLSVYVKEEVDGTISEIFRKPSLGHIPRRLYDTSHFLLTAYSGFNELFGLDVSSITAKQREKLETLVFFED